MNQLLEMQLPVMQSPHGIDPVTLAEAQTIGGGPSYRLDQCGNSRLNVNVAKLFNNSAANWTTSCSYQVPVMQL